MQVATLTVSVPEAAPGQEVRIANSAYTITSNFGESLTVTVPIYCWGEYTISSDGMSTRKTNITDTQRDYAVTLYYRMMLYNYGDECVDITGGWTIPGGHGKKGADHMQLNNPGNSNTIAYTNKKVDARGYRKLYMLFDCVSSTHSQNYSGGISIATAQSIPSRIKSEMVTVGVGSGLLIELDVTSYQAEYYPLIYTYYCGLKAYQVWLE